MEVRVWQRPLRKQGTILEAKVWRNLVGSGKELEEGWRCGLGGEKWAPVNTRRIQGEQTFLVMSCRIQKSGELSYLT